MGTVVEIMAPLKLVTFLTSVELGCHYKLLHCFDFHVVLNFVFNNSSNFMEDADFTFVPLN